MSDKVFIGIDTSNYTTSFAISTENGEILNNFKILLPVKQGERGLRQSEAVFAHIKNLPKIAEQIRESVSHMNIAAIGYSAYPRDTEGSYMPCFLVGEALANILSSVENVPLYKFSHQAGHIRAAVYSSGAAIDGEFIAFHVSGGTTEILKVQPTNGYYNIEIIGQSNDLHAGQAIDRIGVHLGLDFPCGRVMEEYAKKNTAKIPKKKTSVQNLVCNLSGLENLALNVYKETQNKELTCAFTIDFIGNVILELTENLRKEYPEHKIVYGGGVLSNSIIQGRLSAKFKNVNFAEAQFSSDNASGTALLARDKYFN